MRTIKPVGKGVWTDYSCPKAHGRCPPQSPSCKMDFRKALLCQSLPQPRSLPLVLTLRMVLASKQVQPSVELIQPEAWRQILPTHPCARVRGNYSLLRVPNFPPVVCCWIAGLQVLRQCITRTRCRLLSPGLNRYV